MGPINYIKIIILIIVLRGHMTLYMPFYYVKDLLRYCMPSYSSLELWKKWMQLHKPVTADELASFTNKEQKWRMERNRQELIFFFFFVCLFLLLFFPFPSSASSSSFSLCCPRKYHIENCACTNLDTICFFQVYIPNLVVLSL